MARTRTTKKLAQRIDLNYFKRPTPLKRAKLWLSLALPLVALIWIAAHFAMHDSRVYSSGRLSNPHAVFETQCAACHVEKAGAYSAKAENSACLACHDGPIHHAEQTRMPNCAECHVEHRGKINLSAASNQSCAQCHSELRTNGGAAHFSANISSLENGHPEFRAAATNHDPGTIKLNHKLHMQPIRSAPGGPSVQLECFDCHRPPGVTKPWIYADGKYLGITASYTDKDQFLTASSSSLKARNPATGRELMAPVKFATACAGCHLLTFDKRFDDGVPHDKPEVVHTFLMKKFGAYIATHSNELHEMQDPSRDLSGKLLQPRMRTLSAPQWVAEKVAVAEELLSHKTCAQCHQMTKQNLPDTSIARWSPANVAAGTVTSIANLAAGGNSAGMIGAVAPANITLRWLPHSRFDHDAHTGFTCVSCHAKALTSTESSELLIPGIATCRTCHAPGPNHAESRCFECHTYHDWSQRKEVKPAFRLPALHTGGE
ncbi:MAG: hypothetical protein JSS69_04160 [Acidobacteria bacterium]|nr:hypothetical protein [Acidobacteriota bacterium]MBS1865090.1 hypothetical protein [Acidobacteriota bacterium]